MDHFHIALSEDQLRAVSSIGLALVGDAVYELLVRTWLCAHGKATGKDLHRAAIALVCAPEQSRRAQRILPLLTALVYAPLYLLRTSDWRGTIALALIFPAMLWAHRSNFARWREGKEQTFRQFLFGRHEPQREEAGE